MLTVQDSINILSLHFINNNTLKFSELEKLIPDEFKSTAERESALASLISAVNFSEFTNLLQTVFLAPNDFSTLYYILKKPLCLEKQNIQINGMLAARIAPVVNSFIADKNCFCNPLQINEIDIEHLVNIIQLLSSDEKEQKS